MDAPETRFVKSGDAHIAYQAVGEGPLDLLFMGEWFCHLDMQWEEPVVARCLARLAGFSRLILLDPRGSGLSDPVSLQNPPRLEQWMDDIRVVLDAVGSERASVVGVGGGGPMTMLLTASHPDRVSALMLVNTFARLPAAPDFPVGVEPEAFARFMSWITPRWGNGDSLLIGGPSLADDEGFRRWHGRLERQSVSPGAYEATLRMMYELDLRSILPTISVPTRVVHRSGDQLIPVGLGRDLAQCIPGATYIELTDDNHLFYAGDSDALFDEIEEFLTGVRPTPHADRMLATVLFTDVVGSTERAAEVGDRRWRETLERHHAVVRRQLDRFRGREVDTAGDGFFATFDGPARAIHCAEAIRDGLRALGVDVRIGLHTGECEVVGEKVGGIAVHIGARVMGCAGAGDIVVSRTVVDLVAGSGLEFEDRGSHPLKGVPGEWQLYAVKS